MTSLVFGSACIEVSDDISEHDKSVPSGAFKELKRAHSSLAKLQAQVNDPPGYLLGKKTQSHTLQCQALRPRRDAQRGKGRLEPEARTEMADSREEDSVWKMFQVAVESG
jgi:hypothetical protein